MKRLFAFLFLLVASPALADEGPAYGPRLEGFDYPFPVSQFRFTSQGEAMEMAYMDVRPTRPNGRTVALLHGKNFCAATWEGTINALRDAGYRIVAIDQVGFCKSTKPAHYQYSFEQLAANTHALLQSLGISKITIMGHSMGGKTVMNFALKYPERVEKLIVADISPRYYPVHHESILQGLSSLDLKVIQSRKEADEQLAKYIPELGVRQFLLKSLSRDSDGFVWKINIPVITKNIENVGEALPEGEKFDGPTLFLAGANSNYIQQKDMTDMETHFPNYELEFVADAGHWLHAEQPKAVVVEMRKFLK
jgi:pimeloyl-ACP methyl ester carboxylesterase